MILIGCKCGYKCCTSNYHNQKELHEDTMDHCDECGKNNIRIIKFEDIKDAGWIIELIGNELEDINQHSITDFPEKIFKAVKSAFNESWLERNSIDVNIAKKIYEAFSKEFDFKYGGDKD